MFLFETIILLLAYELLKIFQIIIMVRNYPNISHYNSTQWRIIGAVRGAHSQLWGTIIPVCSLYAARKYDRRFGTPAIVWFTGWNYTYMPNVWFTGRKNAYMSNVMAIFPIKIILRK